MGRSVGLGKFKKKRHNWKIDLDIISKKGEKSDRRVEKNERGDKNRVKKGTQKRDKKGE